MNVKEAVSYWKKSAEEDIKTADSLFASKRYAHCLFFCHLFLEKMLKALVEKKTKKHAPYEHNLLHLAELSGIPLSQEQINLLDDMTMFNIRARYPDHKLKLYKQATKEYTQKYFTNSKEMYIWLKKKL